MKRKRNKKKDRYEIGDDDWKYAIEGQNIDKAKMRIVLTFTEDMMLIITVIKIDGRYS